MIKLRCLLLALIAGWVPPLTSIAQDAPEETAQQETATGDETGREAASAPAEIYLAAKDGHLARLKSLIAAGADINAVNAQGRSALMGAVYVRNRRIVRELLMEGANVNTVDAEGRTALMFAVVNGDMEIVQMLLDAGADVSIQDKNKHTATSIAERHKNKSLVKLLDSASS